MIDTRHNFMTSRFGNEELCYPHLFPRGTGGIDSERPVPLNPAQYYQLRLESDRRFSADTSYLFRALNHVLSERVSASAGYSASKIRGRIDVGEAIDASDLTCSTEKLIRP